MTDAPLLKDDRIRVLWTSDNFNYPTGFGTQTFNLVNALAAKPDLQMALLGWQHLGNIIKSVGNGFTLYPNDPQAHAFGASMMPYHLKDFKPHLVVSLADWWMTLYIGNIRRESNWRWLHWLPVDGIPYGDSKWSDQFNLADDIVMMSHFGVDQMVESVDWAHNHQKDVTFHLDYIPLGVDPDVFRLPTAEEKVEARKEFGLPEDAFVIGSVGRNQIRKDYPTFLEACKDFYEWLGPKAKKVRVFMHTVPNDNAGWSLEWMRAQVHLEDFVVFDPHMPLPNLGLPPKEMAKVYWAMDVHALPTRGEGFGVPIIEAMACGLPNIITDITTGPELLGSRYDLENPLVGCLVPVQNLYTEKGGVKRAVVSREGFFEALKYVYEHPDFLKEVAPRARNRAVRLYNVNDVAEQWYRLLKTRFSEWHNKPIADMYDRVRQAVGPDVFDRDYMAVREVDSQFTYNKSELMVIKEFGKGSEWLEVGVGSGESLVMLTRDLGTVRIQGVDLSPASIRMCRDKGLFVQEMPAEKLAFPDNSFDTAYSQHTLEHCRSDTKPFLEMVRVARQAVIVSLPYKNMRDMTHRREYDERRVHRLAHRVAALAVERGYAKSVEARVDERVMPTSLVIVLRLQKVIEE